MSTQYSGPSSGKGGTIVYVSTVPVISGVTSSNILMGSATIGWITDVASDSKVCYSTDHSYSTCTTLDTTQVFIHSVGLSGLAANTQYFYVVKSQGITGGV